MSCGVKISKVRSTNSYERNFAKETEQKQDLTKTKD